MLFRQIESALKNENQPIDTIDTIDLQIISENPLMVKDINNDLYTVTFLQNTFDSFKSFKIKDIQHEYDRKVNVTKCLVALVSSETQLTLDIILSPIPQTSMQTYKNILSIIRELAMRETKSVNSLQNILKLHLNKQIQNEEQKGKVVQTLQKKLRKSDKIYMNMMVKIKDGMSRRYLIQYMKQNKILDKTGMNRMICVHQQFSKNSISSIKDVLE